MVSRTIGPIIGISVGIVYYLGIVLLGVVETLGAVEGFIILTEVNFAGNT